MASGNPAIPVPAFVRDAWGATDGDSKAAKVVGAWKGAGTTLWASLVSTALVA